jgi:hypothetical protein
MKSMDLFDHDGTGILELMKVDEADKFESDDEAWVEFICRLEKIQTERPNATDKSAIEMAISLLNNWRSYMEIVMRTPAILRKLQP